MAILLNEAARPSCLDALIDGGAVCISAATLTEALIVSEGRGVGAEMIELIERFVDEIVPFDAATAYRAAEAHANWGRGRHRARLNFGDCFAYALAKSRDLPLLYVGQDFRQTDIVSAIA